MNKELAEAEMSLNILWNFIKQQKGPNFDEFTALYSHAQNIVKALKPNTNIAVKENEKPS